MFNQIIDANLNRIAEGLRVIEEYTRFIAMNEKLTSELKKIRHALNGTEIDIAANLKIRDIAKDIRAKEAPPKRVDIKSLLKANFKRVEEGLRVLEEYTGKSVYNSLRYDMYQLEKEIVLNLLKPEIKKGIYLISDKVEVLEYGLKQGVSLIQLRDKNASKSEILKKAEEIKKLAVKYKTPFIINDYLDIVLLVNADGLHTGQDDIAIEKQRELLGPHKLIGRTTHNLKQGLLAQKQGADYVSCGPIWETPSKLGRKAIGFEYLAEANNSLKIPIVAIGGINLDNIKEVIKYNPFLIGLIRDYKNISKFNQLFVFIQ